MLYPYPTVAARAASRAGAGVGYCVSALSISLTDRRAGLEQGARAAPARPPAQAAQPRCGAAREAGVARRGLTLG